MDTQTALALTEELFAHLGGMADRPLIHASSGGRRNTCLQFTCRRLETQGFSGTLVQAQRDLVELRL